MTMSAIATTSEPTSASASTSSAPSSPATGNASKWTARIVAGLAIAFLVFDTSLKLFAAAPAVQASRELGYPPGAFLWIGIVELACLALYVVPRTAPIGAILWTGYLGGAIATHVRLGNPLFSHTLFPIYVAVMLWLPLYLRDTRVRGLLGPRSV